MLEKVPMRIVVCVLLVAMDSNWIKLFNLVLLNCLMMISSYIIELLFRFLLCNQSSLPNFLQVYLNHFHLRMLNIKKKLY